MADTVVTSNDRFIGRVKWFNNKAGYGFITVTSGSRMNSDIFVHHKGIVVSNEQYRYLVQGEYVEFNLDSLKDNSSHEFQAINVSGINNGKLMCETRREFRQMKISYRSDEQENNVEEKEDSVKVMKSPKTPRMRGSGPRDGQEMNMTKNKRNSKQSTSSNVTM